MYTIFETFVGAGGSHLGFKNNGFVSKYVNDIDENCLKTLLYNNPDIEKTAYVDNSDIAKNNYVKLPKNSIIPSGDNVEIDIGIDRLLVRRGF